MLIIFAGLPGTGKTTLSKVLSKKLNAVYLRVDTIEQACKNSKFLNIETVEDAGYLVAYDVAKDNLKNGLTVVADSVNPIAITRNDWLSVGKEINVKAVEIEVVCSDKTEHKRRVESRVADIPNHVVPTWQDVLDREYEPYPRSVLTIDTASKSVETCLNSILSNLKP